MRLTKSPGPDLDADDGCTVRLRPNVSVVDMDLRTHEEGESLTSALYPHKMAGPRPGQRSGTRRRPRLPGRLVLRQRVLGRYHRRALQAEHSAHYYMNMNTVIELKLPYCI